MKKLFLLSILTVMSAVTFAQKEENVLEAMRKPISVEIKQTTVKIEKESRPVFTTYIAADAKALGKAWEKYFKDKYQADISEKKSVYTALNMKMADVTPETVNLIAIIAEDEDGSRLDMALDFGTKFLTQKDEPEIAEKFINAQKAFVNEFYVGWFEKVLEDERKKISKVEKDFGKEVKTDEKLTKDLEGKAKDIVKANEDIVKSEKGIADLKVKIETLGSDIVKYNAEIEALNAEQVKQKEVVAAKKITMEEMQKQLELLKANADKIKVGQ